MSTPASSGKLWGGRFTGATDPLFEAFNASISFDRRLWRADIVASQEYARALARAKVISDDEADRLVSGLQQVAEDWKNNSFQLVSSDEDIHTANERALSSYVGVVAGKLHTGRSRNDQVATDLRLFLIEHIKTIQREMVALIAAVVDRASADTATLMPGYTHLQPAQVIRWSHFLLSYAAPFIRDAERLHDLSRRVSRCPLGSGALAGNPFGIDRETLAKQLGFDGVTYNSLDAVSDRDFVAEFLFFAALCFSHVSQISEDLIIMSSRKHVALSDAYSTGSSLMPQKKNPDALELLRGKTGRVTGGLMSVLLLLKSLPRAYNKDLQEDKEPLFDAVTQLEHALPILSGVVSTLTIDSARMRSALSGEMLATDLAEYLVRKGVPFRETHHVAGAAVRLAESKGVELTALTLTDLAPLHPAFESDVVAIWDFERSAESRDVIGGTSRRSQNEQIKTFRDWIQRYAADNRIDIDAERTE